MKKMLFLLFIIFALLYSFLPINTCAVAQKSGFVKEKMETSEQQKMISKFDIEPIKVVYPNCDLFCFDVSDTECIAIGGEQLSKKIISVYNKDGDFLYGYSLNVAGKFGVGWNGINLSIYFVREKVAITVNDNCEILSCETISDSTYNDSYWNNEVFLTQRNQNDNCYTMKNKTKFINLISMSSYSLIEKTDATGKTNIIYDNSFNFAVRQITKVLLVFVLIGSVIIVFCKQKNVIESNTKKILNVG